MTTIFSPLFAAGLVEQFVATSAVALLAFAAFAGALAIPALRGRKLKRTCACAASKIALKTLEERERAKMAALRYRPETVDVSQLPILSEDLVEYTSRDDGANA